MIKKDVSKKMKRNFFIILNFIKSCMNFCWIFTVSIIIQKKNFPLTRVSCSCNKYTAMIRKALEERKSNLLKTQLHTSLTLLKQLKTHLTKYLNSIGITRLKGNNCSPSSTSIYNRMMSIVYLMSIARRE